MFERMARTLKTNYTAAFTTNGRENYSEVEKKLETGYFVHLSHEPKRHVGLISNAVSSYIPTRIWNASKIHAN